MATLDRLERLTDLVLVLLNARTPRTLEEIAAAVPGYPPTRAARRQAFERDKRILRDEGIPVVTEPVEGPEQYGYRIDPEAFYLPDLQLTPDEQAALHLAVAGVHLGDPSGRDALAKLGASGVAEARTLAQVDAPAALVPLFDALRARAEVRFTYHGASRSLAPSRLEFRAGRWYLVGWDRGRDAARTFRVDRIEALAPAGPPGSGVVPDALEAAPDAGVAPFHEDDEAAPVLIRVDAVEGPRVVAEVGEGAVAERGADSTVLLSLGVTTFDMLRSWVLGLADHAEIVGPPSARAAVIAWLEEIAAGGSPRTKEEGPGRPPGDAAGAPASASKRDEVVGSRARTPESNPAARGPAGAASTRLRRLLAIVARLAEVGEAPISELARRFDMTPDEVVHELELAACCGMPPYSPDTLLEIVVSDDTVRAFLPRELARPRRLTPAEGLALAASARTILAVPGADRDGALARALHKLEVVLGDHQRLVIRIDAPPLLREVQELVEEGEQAEIVYHSASTDETTERTIDPLDVVSFEGHWYLDAYCHKAQSVRRFRIDRIRDLRRLGTVVPARAGLRAAQGAFVPGPGAETVTLALEGDARWVADSVPVLAERSGPGASVEVTLAVGGRAWLERLLLQAGPRAHVLSPPHLERVAAAAAARLLENKYGVIMKGYEKE